MSSASMSFGRNARYHAPRGAVWAAAAVGGLMNLIHRIDQWQLTRRSAEPQSAAEVLELARQVEKSDPGFAADLRAAVQRSEQNRK
jgi:hypothetical protein